jgi:putative endonuclease
MMAAYVYIISNKSHTLYTGIATDLVRRMEQHRNGTYRNGFTARYHFDRLVWFEMQPSLAAAARREKQIKNWRRVQKVALIQEKNPNWKDLSVSWEELFR